MRFFQLIVCALLVPFFAVGQQDILDSLKTAFLTAESDADKSILLVHLSQMSVDRLEALDYAQQSTKFAKTNIDLSTAWNQVAWSQKNLFQFDSALLFVEKALEYAKQTNLPISVSDVYNTYGSIFNNQSMFDSAIHYHKLALEARVEANDQEGQAISMNNISIALQRIAKYDEASEYIDKSIEIYEAIGNRRQKADAFLNKGNLLTNAGDLDGAYENFQIALKNYKALGLNVMMTYALINMGEVAIELKDIDRGKKNFLQSLAILNDNGQIANLMAFTLNGLGAIYEGYDMQSDSAIFYFKEGLSFAKAAGNQYLQSISHYNLGLLYLGNEQFEAALADLETARDLKSEIGDKAGLSLVLAGLGTTYGKQKAYAEAEKSLTQALEIAKEVGDVSNLERVHGNLYKYNKSRGRFEEALDNYETLSVLSDSLLNMEHMSKVSELNIEYDTEKQQQQIELQDAQILGQDARLQRNQALIIGLIVAAVLLVLIVVLVRNRAQKDKMLIKREGELKLREAEINAVIGSQEKERNRFARDLHDGFGQMISVLKMNLGQLGNGASKNPEKQLEVFEQSEKVISDMYTELRNICFDLMPQTLVQQGLPDALKEFGYRVSDTGRKVLEVLIFDMDERLDELTEVSLYRISQEWVNNVLKYSGADHITLQLTRDEEELTLTIEDDGAGFDPEDFFNGKGNGWRNVQTRVNLIKGEFVLDSRPGVKGSMVSVNVPVALLKKIPTSTDKQITV